MSNFVIIPDTSSDLIKPLRERFDIPAYISGVVNFPDGHTELSDLDWERYQPHAFYDSMKKSKTMYTTSSAPIGNITQVFEEQLQQGKDILCITLSSALSGTYSSCIMVQNQLLEKYPQRKIICVDSKRYSTAIALLVILAAQQRDAGASLEETAQLLEQTKHCIHQMGPMDDLFFLTKTGRISNVTAFFGTLIGVNPMADFNRNGLAEVLGKFKGKKAAFDATLQYIKATITHPEDQILFVAHSNRPEAAQHLAQRIQQEIGPKEIIINDVGMSCGASIGPGLCTAFYIGTEISQDTVKEKELLALIAQEQKAAK